MDVRERREEESGCGCHGNKIASWRIEKEGGNFN
jgi:hypothetical protein